MAEPVDRMAPFRRRSTDDIRNTAPSHLDRIKKDLGEMTPIQIANRVRTLESLVSIFKRRGDVDSKTNLPTARAFTDVAQMMFKEAEANPKQQITIALTDIDHFGPYNSTYGEQKGDDALVAVADTLKESVREEDLIARWGGEEFSIAIDQTAKPGQKGEEPDSHPLERVRTAVSILQSEKLQKQLTLSVGASVYMSGDSFEEVFERAERAQMVAKLLGRDRTIVALPTGGDSIRFDDITHKQSYLGDYKEGKLFQLTNVETQERHVVVEKEGKKPVLEKAA